MAPWVMAMVVGLVPMAERLPKGKLIESIFGTLVFVRVSH
jgi:hypothetical protein